MYYNYNNYYNHNNYLAHHGVKNMKWGVRRYQNKDGTLTDAGKKRYARDQRENSGKKKGNKVGEADPNRWVKEDMERSKRLTEASSRMVNDLDRINNNQIKKAPRTKMDLSSMTDKQMREEINRAMLERQYNDIFNPQTTSKGREHASKILESAGNVLAVTGSALGIALAIKELRG